MTPVPLLAALLFASPSPAEDQPGVLLIGDSHTAGTFGHTFDKDLRAPKTARIATFGVCSSRPQSFLSGTEHACGWFFSGYDGTPPPGLLQTRPGTIVVHGQERRITFVRTPALSNLLAIYAPKAVIVALGSNGLSASSVQETLKLIHAGKDDGNDRACFWIGPPRMRSTPARRLDGYYDVLAANKVSAAASPLGDSCKLIVDSRALDFLVYPEKGGDGTHYEADGLSALAVKWGHAAYDAFAKALRP